MRVLITGASSGIGAALCRRYAKPGNTVHLLAQNRAGLEAAAKACAESGAEARVHCADVSDAAQMTRIGGEIIAGSGLPDIVVANAGIRMEDPAGYENSTAAYDVMMVNYIGTVNTFSPFIGPMMRRGGGHLAAVSSIAALRATPNSGIYSASKAAINLWTEALRLKLAPHNICVTTACSGFVRTAMTSSLPFYMPGILSADQAARIIEKAIESRKSRIVFPWQSRLIWGAFRAMPGPLYDQVVLAAKKFWPNRTRERGASAHEV